MLCVRLWDLFGSVTPIGPAIPACGFSDGLGLARPSTLTKLAYHQLSSPGTHDRGQCTPQACFVMGFSAQHARPFNSMFRGVSAMSCMSGFHVTIKL
jgi:hypothetical protein